MTENKCKRHKIGEFEYVFSDEVEALEKQLSEKEARIKELEFIINSDIPSSAMLLNSGKKIASLEAEVARWQKEFGIAGRKVTTLSQKLEKAVKALKMCVSVSGHPNSPSDGCLAVIRVAKEALKALKQIGESDDLS